MLQLFPCSPGLFWKKAAPQRSAHLGIHDAGLHSGHALVLPEQLDLADLAELGQHSGEVGLEVNNMADAVTGSHQESGGWLLLVLVPKCARQTTFTDRCGEKDQGEEAVKKRKYVLCRFCWRT